MKQLLHPSFKLNGKAFPTVEALTKQAAYLINKGTDEEVSIGKFISEWLNDTDVIRVKTSGSTGVPKNISLQKKHVFNSAEATVNYFNLKENSKALLCMPAAYIAGKMMLVRAMIAGWDLHTVLPAKSPLEKVTTNFDFSAMVPYQVFYSLKDLHKVKKLLIGGGAVTSDLEKQLQQCDTAVFASYGMTETISHIAVRSLNGKNKSEVFNALPHVSFSQTDSGCLQIHALKISEAIVVTNDVVELVSPTSFKFLGRIDNVINSGGLKIHPEVVEEKLSAFIDIPFFIASEEDEALGNRVILILESENPVALEAFTEAFKSLVAYEKPKAVYNTSQFVYTETAKIKRAEVLKTLFNK